MSLFRSLFGGRPSTGSDPELGGPFTAGLVTYPPWQLPHAGPPSALRDEQLDDNLRWFLDSRETRIAAVLALLGDCRADASPLLDPRGDGAAAVAAVQLALEQELPARAELPGDRDPARDFLMHEAIGPRIFFAFAADLGTLIGDAVALRRPGTHWAIARDQQDIGTPFYRTIVLDEAARGGHPRGAFDMLGATIGSVYELRREGVGLRPDLGELLTAHV